MAQKRYESTFILPTTLAEDAMAAIVKRFEDAVTSNGGTMIETEKWGIRRLAYPINNQTSAHYYSLHYTAGPETNARLDRVYHLDEDVLRWLTLEMPDQNFAGRAAMKTRVETVEARRTAKAEEERAAENR